MNDIIITIIGSITSIVLILITGFVIPWLQAKAKLVKDENARLALEQLINLTMQTIAGVVQSLSQTMVRQYVKDGKWNADTKKLVLAEAVRLVRLSLTSEQAAQLVAQTKMTFEEWVTNKVEAYIHDSDPNKYIVKNK